VQRSFGRSHLPSLKGAHVPHIYAMKMLGKVLWSAAVWCGLISVVLHAAGADSLSVSLFAAVVGGLVSLEGLPEGFRLQ
jgi:hypothetical protein